MNEFESDPRAYGDPEGLEESRRVAINYRTSFEYEPELEDLDPSRFVQLVVEPKEIIRIRNRTYCTAGDLQQIADASIPEDLPEIRKDVDANIRSIGILGQFASVSLHGQFFKSFYVLRIPRTVQASEINDSADPGTVDNSLDSNEGGL